MKIKKFTKFWPWLLILLLCWWAVKPLFHSGFFSMHDDTQVVRVQQMAQALKDGQFPVRWVKDLGYGYGYPIFNFYAPLAYYIGAIFNLIGFDALAATKIVFGLGIILAGIFMYLLAREFWGVWGGIVSALFYLYAPYHALDIYVRGAVGEFWAMAFLPLVFYGLYRIAQGHRRGVITTALALTAVILVHNLTAMMFIPFLFLMLFILFIFQKDKKRFVIWNLKFVILAAGLAAFYWLPALTEMKLTKVFGQIGGGANWRDHFVFFDQLWASPWGFGGSAPGRLDGMSFMIGKIHLLVAGLVLLIAIAKKKLRPVLLVSLGFLLIVLFLTNDASGFIWQTIPVMAFIQYPWRFLAFSTLAVSFMAGSLISWQPKKLNWWPAVISSVFIIGLLVLNTKYFQPQTFLGVTAAGYINEENIKWKISKISDEYLPKEFPVPQSEEEIAWEKVKVIEGEAEIKSQDFKHHLYQLEIEARTDSQILVNTAYFPGWRIFVDDEKVAPRIEAGRIKFALNPGAHRVILKFVNTPVRRLANLISLLSLAGLGLGMLKYLYGRTRISRD